MSIRNFVAAALVMITFVVALPGAVADTCPQTHGGPDYVLYLGCGTLSTGVGGQQGHVWTAVCDANTLTVECVAVNFYSTGCQSVYYYGYASGSNETFVCLL